MANDIETIGQYILYEAAVIYGDYPTDEDGVIDVPNAWELAGRILEDLYNYQDLQNS